MENTGVDRSSGTKAQLPFLSPKTSTAALPRGLAAVEKDLRGGRAKGGRLSHFSGPLAEEESFLHTIAP